jgi:hypothetical protein
MVSIPAWTRESNGDVSIFLMELAGRNQEINEQLGGIQRKCDEPTKRPEEGG